MPPPTAPPIGAPGAAVAHDHVMRSGRVYHVYLAAYDERGLWRAWRHMPRHAREWRGVSGIGTTATAPRLLSRTPQGDVFEAQVMVITWRSAGSEYTWGDLHGWLQNEYAKDGVTGTLAGWCQPRETTSGEDLAIGAQDVNLGVNGAIDSGLRTAGSVLREAPAVGEAVAGAADATGQALRGAGEAGRAVGDLPPLVAFGTFVGIAVGVFLLARELK